MSSISRTLIDLQKDKTYDYAGRANTGEDRFASGECAIFLTSSGYYGDVKSTAKFDFTSAPMPYYPDVKGAPQNSIIGGASLWVMGGKKPEEYKGVAKFFTFLSETDRQVQTPQGLGLSADHQGRLRKDGQATASTKEPYLRDAADGTDQQGADRKFPRAALRQHGSDARPLGRGTGSSTCRQERPPRKRWMRRSRAAMQCCVRSKDSK